MNVLYGGQSLLALTMIMAPPAVIPVAMQATYGIGAEVETIFAQRETGMTAGDYILETHLDSVTRRYLCEELIRKAEAVEDRSASRMSMAGSRGV